MTVHDTSEVVHQTSMHSFQAFANQYVHQYAQSTSEPTWVPSGASANSGSVADNTVYVHGPWSGNSDTDSGNWNVDDDTSHWELVTLPNGEVVARRVDTPSPVLADLFGPDLMKEKEQAPDKHPRIDYEPPDEWDLLEV